MGTSEWALTQAGAWWMSLAVRDRWELACKYPRSTTLEIMRAEGVEVPSIPHGWFKPCRCARCVSW